MKSRAMALRAIQEQSFDVCVIGGGATGAGCALDSQLRGLKTVLLEAGDFASGTSSASTKMIHGGVRYLEEAVRGFDIAEYDVVRRALRERIHMLENGPFLTRAREFITPCYSWLDLAYYEAGLKLYDWIAGSAGLAPSYFISREDALRRMPNVKAEGLVGAVAYTDGQFDDARYNLVLIETFVEAGGEALNYARVQSLERGDGGKLVAADVEDRLTGNEFVVRARAFVNATGPQADTIRKMVNPGAPPRIRPSKGVHILLPLALLMSDEAMLIPKTDDGRVLFAIPWMGRLVVGTTEQEIEPGSELFLTRDEVEYLLRHLNRYLDCKVLPSHVVAGFAGARPLLSAGDSRDTAKLARDHEVEVDSNSGLISIIGGKWTTYRAMAEDTIDAVAQYLDVSTLCSTMNHRLAGTSGYSADYWTRLAAQAQLGEDTARHLGEKFGTRAEEVIALVDESAGLREPLVHGLAPIRAEVAFVARHEMAASIEDVLARRIGVQMHGWNEAIAAAPATADLLANELGWSDTQKQQALADYVAHIHTLLQRAGLATEPQSLS
jgi:glycerol-3-phosphate dehydrogenase